MPLAGFFTDTSLPPQQIFYPTAVVPDEGTWPYDRVVVFLMLECFFLPVPVPQFPTGLQALRQCRVLPLEVAPSSTTHIWSGSIHLMPRRNVLILCGDGMT